MVQLLELGHSVGQLLHYGADAQLRELVIREPQWLLDAICCIVRQFRIHVGPFDAKAQRIVPDSWDDLTTKGLLREDLLPFLWGEARFAQHRPQLVRLLAKFNIIVERRGRRGERPSYLVPALLPKETVAPPPAAGQLVCLLHLSTAGRAPAELEVPWARLSAEGVSARNAFARLLAKAIDWQQHTSAGGGSECRASRADALISFGQDVFVLALRDELHSIELRMQPAAGAEANAAPILERLRAFLHAICNECMPNVRVSVLVARGDAAAGGGGAAARPLLNLAELVRCMDDGLTVLLSGSAQALAGAALREAFAAWLPPAFVLELLDVFLSYRWSEFDSRWTLLEHDCLSLVAVGKQRRRVRTFLDRKSLRQGERFDKAFMLAMLHSKVLVPHVSNAALLRMEFLTPASPCDNVLLEWTVALELEAQRPDLRVLPMVLGRMLDTADGPRMANFFTDRPPRADPDRGGQPMLDAHTGEPVPDARSAVERLPEGVVVQAVVEKAAEFLREQGLAPSAELATRSAGICKAREGRGVSLPRHLKHENKALC